MSKRNNTYNGFISEQCSVCGKKFKKVSEIYVVKSTDQYICEKCKERYQIECSECGSLYSEDDE